MLCNEQIDRKYTNPVNLMYECEICFEIYHLECYNVRLNLRKRKHKRLMNNYLFY